MSDVPARCKTCGAPLTSLVCAYCGALNEPVHQVEKPKDAKPFDRVSPLRSGRWR